MRWQVRKAAPFRIEDAQLSYMPSHKAADGSTEFVVVMARKDIIREYEAVCEAAGAQAGVVDLTTFNVINAVLASAAAAGGRLAARARHPGRRHDGDSSRRVARVLPQPHRRRGSGPRGSWSTRRRCTTKIVSAASGFSRVVLAGGGSPASQGAQDADYLRRALEQRLGTKVDSDRSAQRRDPDGSHHGQYRAARRARAARRPAGAGAGSLTMLRTNLSTRPFYNERGVHARARSSPR